MLVGIPLESENKIKLFYFDRNKLIQLAKIPEMLLAPKTKGSQTITFSPKILNYKPTIYLRISGRGVGRIYLTKF